MDELQCLTQAEVKAVIELSEYPPPHWQQMVPYLEERLLRGTGTGLSWQGQERSRQILEYVWHASLKADWADRAETLFRRELKFCACHGELAECWCSRAHGRLRAKCCCKASPSISSAAPELSGIWLNRWEDLIVPK